MSQNSANGLVSVSREKSSITYIINEKSLFFQDGYKTLLTYSKEGFIKCSKSNINGRVKLTYDVSRFDCMEDILPHMTDVQYLKVLTGLLNTAILLRDIGFIQHENISLTVKDIFIDQKSMRPYLIYLPLNIRPSANAHIVFEKELREKLVTLANSYKNVTSPFVIEICKDLIVENASFKAIVEKITKHDILVDAESKHRRPKIIGDTVSVDSQNIEDKVKPIVKEDEKQRPRVNLPQKSYDKSYDSSSKPQQLSGHKSSKKKKTSVGKTILFFLIYIVILLFAFFISFNYYKTSGMTPGFVFVLIAMVMGALLVPVIYFSKGEKKQPVFYAELPEEKVEGIGRVVEGHIPSVVLRSLNDPNHIEFFINQKEFIIGKDPQLVNGFIPFDKSIGDMHCKVIWESGFFILDLDSDYGTFVNEVRVVPGQKFPLKNKDKIKITKHYFEVLLEK